MSLSVIAVLISNIIFYSGINKVARPMRFQALMQAMAIMECETFSSPKTLIASLKISSETPFSEIKVASSVKAKTAFSSSEKYGESFQAFNAKSLLLVSPPFSASLLCDCMHKAQPLINEALTLIRWYNDFGKLVSDTYLSN